MDGDRAEQLRAMGYPEAAISLALEQTPGGSTETAAVWLMDHQGGEELEAEQQVRAGPVTWVQRACRSR